MAVDAGFEVAGNEEHFTNEGTRMGRINMVLRAEHPMTDRQLHFCYEYLKHFNATRAAIAAGYSKNTAGQIGAENLKKPYIRRLIAQLQVQQLQHLFLSKEAILAELIRYGFKNRHDSYGTVSPRIALDALTLLGQHVGLFGSPEAPEEGLKKIHEAFRRASVVLNKRKAERAGTKSQT